MSPLDSVVLLPADATNKPQIICLHHFLKLILEMNKRAHVVKNDAIVVKVSIGDEWVDSLFRLFVLIRQIQ